MIDLGDVRAAAGRIAGSILRTPAVASDALSRATGAAVTLKLDNLQATGAFKERGAANRLALLDPAERAAGVIAMSAGNHAQAVARHAQLRDISAVIVMPRFTPATKVRRTAGWGARVVLHGDSLAEAAAHAHALAEAEGRVFIHPYDDPAVMAGQGTLALELLEDAPDLDTLVIPVGGGGLIAGCAVAAKAMKPDIRVFGVEAAMYPSFSAKRRGEAPKCGGQTIAEGIAIKAVGDIPFAIADPLVEAVLVCQEADFETAMAYYATLEKTVAEGAGAGGLAALLAYPERFKGMKVGLVLCGGNIDARMLAVVLNRELVREKKMVVYRILGDDRPGMLSKMSAVIGGLGGNIIDVVHNRLALDVPAKGAEFDIMVETRGAAHADDIRLALEEAGYALRMG